MATHELHGPQADDGSRRRQEAREALFIEETVRYAAELGNEDARRWLLHTQRQSGRTEAALRAELILPPGVRGDAGIAALLRRYNTDPEFHAKIHEAVEMALQQERERVILDAKGKPYLIQTEDGLPANTAAAMLEEIRKIRTWEEIEQQALNEKERQEAAERTLTCIWCGKVCSDPDDLEAHEDECA